MGKINKYLKNRYNKNIQQIQQDLPNKMPDAFLIDNSFSMRENARMIEEVKAFNKQYFIKNEKKRYL